MKKFLIALAVLGVIFTADAMTGTTGRREVADYDKDSMGVSESTIASRTNQEIEPTIARHDPGSADFDGNGC